MRKFLLFGLLVLFLAPAGRAWAAPELRLVAPPKKANTEKPFTYKILLEWPVSEGRYEAALSAPSVSNLEVVNQHQSVETVDSISRMTVLFEFRGMKRGEGKIGSIELRYRHPGEETWQTLPVPGQTIAITPALPWKLVLILLALILGIPPGAWFIWKRFRQYRETQRMKKIPPPDPKQVAYAKAEEMILTFKGETQNETLTHWSNALKKAIRIFYDIPSSSVTEADFLTVIRNKSISREELREMEALFRQLEELKFTGQALTVREMESFQKTLLQYVRGKIIIGNSPR